MERILETTPAEKSHIRRLYDWMLHWADTKYGMFALICLSFMESSFFPIPPDVLLMALVLSNPKKWWQVALACTAASVAGGIFGYGIGAFAWASVGSWIMENIIHIKMVLVEGKMDIPLPTYLIATMGESLGGTHLFQVYEKWNAWIVFAFGLTPLPYKLVTISAGVAQVNVGVFIFASILSRGLRFFAVAAILRVIGEPAKKIIDQHFNKLTVLFMVLLIGGFLLVKVVF